MNTKLEIMDTVSQVGNFWNRKCRKKTWWQQEFAVFKCEATAIRYWARMREQ